MLRSAALLAVVAGLCLPAAATARIVPGTSIAGVSVTATQAELVKALGPYSRKDVGEEESDYGLFWNPRKFHALIETSTRRAFLISTTSTAQRTASGVGPGVSEKTARRRLRGERCTKIYDADRRIDVLSCVLRSAGADTGFSFYRGRLLEVTIDATE